MKNKKKPENTEPKLELNLSLADAAYAQRAPCTRPITVAEIH